MHIRFVQQCLGVITGLALAWLAVALPAPILARGAPAAAAAQTFTINSPADIPDSTPGDGVCETALRNGICTLRGAIQEANALPGADTIQLQANTTYLLTRPGHDQTGLNGALVITDSVTLLGAGPDSTILDGNGAAIGDGVFKVFAGLNSVVTISGVTIQHGLSSAGGGIVNDSRLTINHSHIVSNTVNGSSGGGGIFTSTALTITDSLISGNVVTDTQGMGGGIMNNDVPLVLIRSTVSNNHIAAGTQLFGGGGIFGGAWIIDSTISGNSAFRGGGIFVQGRSLTVINSTISANDSFESGGGVYSNNAVTQLFNATVAGNRANADASGAGIGGGVLSGASGGTVTIDNSVLANNDSIRVLPDHAHHIDADDCAGTVTSQGADLVAAGSGLHCTLIGPFTQANPLLGLLQDNGGPTLTQALLTGSPAIDAGNAGACTDDVGGPLATDQRGYPRTANGAGQTRCDLGAYEVQRLIDLPLVRR